MRVRPDNRPLYQQAEEALLGLLATLSPGDQLPPEPTLAHSFGISRATLREALRHLEQKRLITRRQGLGTFYNGPRVLIDSGLESLVSVDTLAARQGLPCSTTGLEVSGEPAGSDYAPPLHLEPVEPVTVVRRTKVSAEAPIAYMVDVLPQSVATPEVVQKEFQGSVLDLLLARPELGVSHAVANIALVEAGRDLGQHLQTARATVLLLLEETVYTHEGVPVDYSRNYFVPQYFQFHLVRHVPT